GLAARDRLSLAPLSGGINHLLQRVPKPVPCHRAQPIIEGTRETRYRSVANPVRSRVIGAARDTASGGPSRCAPDLTFFRSSQSLVRAATPFRSASHSIDRRDRPE